MGLDVYLYDRASHEQNQRHVTEWNALYERKERGEITEADYDEQRKTITQSAGHVDAPSTVDPTHLFNRRYLRSSYNESGFNNMAAGDHGLYWIFAPLGVELNDWNGLLTPDHVTRLGQCRARAEQVAEEIRQWDRLKVTEFSGPMLGSADHLWSKLPTKDQVLDWGRQELTRDSVLGDSGWSSAKGSLFPAGFEILAVTLGEPEFTFLSRNPVAYAVYRVTDETHQHYVNSALITSEFCDEAIALIDRDGSAHMIWSG